MKKSIVEAIKTELKAARDIADMAEREDRDLSTEERGKLSAHMEKAAQFKKTAEDQDALAKQLSDLSDGIGLHAPSDEEPAQPNEYNARSRKSLGQQFVDSNEFIGLVKSAPNGRFGERARVQSQPYGVKALLTGTDRDTSAGALLTPDRTPLMDTTFYKRPLTIRQLVSPGTTTTDTIEYVRLVDTVNNAAPVPEATSADAIDGTTVTDVIGGIKPQSELAFEKDSTNVKTIAHWIPATKRALSDAAQIRTLIDQFLLYGLEEALEDQLVTGDGTGENLLGLNATSGIQTETASGDVFEKTRRARRKVRIGGRSTPTAFVMNPIDWENVELMRDGTERFMGNGPFSMTTPGLWGLPVVESEAIAAGTAWVAAWNMAVLYDREQASIQVTDSHADFFIRNLVAILAELRVAFCVLRPAAFVKITL